MEICTSATDKEKDMDSIGKIIAFNKRINAAIADGRIEDASKWMRRLHKLERRDREEIGAYRLRGI